jgi:hypothetical protein
MAGDIDRDDADELAELWSGKADAPGVGAHRVDQVGCHLRGPVEVVQRCAPLLQPGVRVLENGTYRHCT